MFQQKVSMKIICLLTIAVFCITTMSYEDSFANNGILSQNLVAPQSIRPIAQFDEDVQTMEDSVDVEHILNPERNTAPFFIEGNSTAVLLIHGLSATPDELRKLGQHLHRKGGYTISGIRLPGHGTNLEDINAIKWRAWVNHVEESFKALSRGYKKVIVVGHSLGGALALNLGMEFPEAIDGIVASAVPYQFSNQNFKKNSISFRDHFTFMKKKKKSEYAKKSDSLVFQERQVFTVNPIHATNQMFQFISFFKKRLLKGDSPILSPTLIIQGGKDTTIDPKGVDTLFRKINSSDKQLKHFLNSGHHLMLDIDRESVFENIFNFVETWAPADGPPTATKKDMKRKVKAIWGKSENPLKGKLLEVLKMADMDVVYELLIKKFGEGQGKSLDELIDAIKDNETLLEAITNFGDKKYYKRNFNITEGRLKKLFRGYVGWLMAYAAPARKLKLDPKFTIFRDKILKPQAQYLAEELYLLYYNKFDHANLEEGVIHFVKSVSKQKHWKGKDSQLKARHLNKMISEIQINSRETNRSEDANKDLSKLNDLMERHHEFMKNQDNKNRHRELNDKLGSNRGHFANKDGSAKRFKDIVLLDEETEVWTLSDMHGDSVSTKQALEDILEESNFKQKVAAEKKIFIVFLGDYTSNGLDSVGTLRTMLEFWDAYQDNVIITSGNHDVKESFGRALFEYFEEQWKRSIKYPLSDKHPENFNHYNHLRLELVRKFGVKEGERLYRLHDKWAGELPTQVYTLDGKSLTHHLGLSDDLLKKERKALPLPNSCRK